MRTKMRNVITGSVTETSFNPTAKFEQAFVDRKDMEYGIFFVPFMPRPAPKE